MRPFARRLRDLAGASFLLVLAGGFVLAVASPAGCAKTPPCARNSDCNGAYCANGECKQDCVDSDLDCPHGAHCNLVAQCESDEPSGSTTSSTTGGGGSASTSTSSSTSTSTSTSASTSSAGGAGPGSTTTSSTTTSATTSSATTSSATTGAGGSNPGGKGMLDLCAADGECAVNLVCRPLYRNDAARRCLPTCSSSASCLAGTRCESIDGTQYCAGVDVGRPCVDGTTCNFACAQGPKYCTMQCASGADCPNGYGCMAVGGQSVCVKAEAPCSSQDASACIVPAACDESPNLIVGGCTLACGSASDCPRRAAGFPSWTCQGGLCRRPSDVRGPLEGGYAPTQYACNAQSQAVNLCNDNQHIDFDAFAIPGPPVVNCASPVTTDGKPGDACLDSCRYQGGCHFGFACTALGSVGNARIGLCLPTGAGEVGAACSSASQCVFGDCYNGKCSRDCTYDAVCPSGSTCLAAGGPAVEGAAFERCQ
jgi:hypothetical protein